MEVYKWRWAHGMGIMVKELCEVMGVKRMNFRVMTVMPDFEEDVMRVM